MKTETQKVKANLHNIETEQSIFACMMMDSEHVGPEFAKLHETDFYSPTHRTIFKIMKGVYDNNDIVDFVTTVGALDKRGELENAGGVEYIAMLNGMLPSAVNFKMYMRELKELSMRREIERATNKILETVRINPDPAEVLKMAEKLIFDIAKPSESNELSQIGKLMPEIIDDFFKTQKDPSHNRGLMTHFHGLDKITNGFKPGQMIVLAARPGVGKTAIGLNMALNVGMRDGKRVAIFTLEMSKEELAKRAACVVSNVSMERAIKGELTPDEQSRIYNPQLMKAFSNSNIYLDDGAMTTPAEIMRKCQRLMRELGGLDLVMIDYLGLMSSPNGRRENRQVEVADNSRAIKLMAKELGVPVLLLSQLNRGIEGRSKDNGDNKPKLMDLRESGAIEQDADMVIFIHRPHMQELNEDDIPDHTMPVANTDAKTEIEDAELIIRKNRGGQNNKIIPLGWIGEQTRFINRGTK